MGFPLPRRRCITVALPGGVSLTAGALQQLLACARRRCGASYWNGAAVDAFRGPGGTLLIVREEPPAAFLADYALPFLQKFID